MFLGLGLVLFLIVTVEVEADGWLVGWLVGEVFAMGGFCLAGDEGVGWRGEAFGVEGEDGK